MNFTNIMGIALLGCLVSLASSLLPHGDDTARAIAMKICDVGMNLVVAAITLTTQQSGLGSPPKFTPPPHPPATSQPPPKGTTP